MGSTRVDSGRGVNSGRGVDSDRPTQKGRGLKLQGGGVLLTDGKVGEGRGG